MTIPLHRATIKDVDCVLIPGHIFDLDYPCRDLKCPRCTGSSCEITGYSKEDMRKSRGCYEPYSGFWSPVTHYLSLRLTGELPEFTTSDL